jgi:uncharacterized protein (DUF1919 family)
MFSIQTPKLHPIIPSHLGKKIKIQKILTIIIRKNNDEKIIANLHIPFNITFVIIFLNVDVETLCSW